MKIFTYKLTKKDNINKLFNDYVNTLSGVYDDFLESHILSSKFYKIKVDNIDIGYFAVFKEQMLSQFYVSKEYINYSQEIFKEIIKKHDIENAFVPTCDELFMSLAIENNTSIEVQAYFFTETDKEVEAPIYDRKLLRKAIPADTEMIKTKTDGFFDNSNTDEQMYILEEDEVIYGFGIIVKNKIHTKYRGTGMYTVAEHRKKGVGRSIILHLKEICHESGYLGLPGCWYYNHASKNTLESCGYISKTRLLNIKFK